MQCGFRPACESESATSNIYLELRTLCKPPTLRLSARAVDFGEIPVGFCKVENLEVTNLGPRPQKLKVDVLPLTCGFSYMGIFDELQPGESQQFSIYFEPSFHRAYAHRFRVTGLDVVSLQLRGRSTFPEIELEPPSDTLDLGFTQVDSSLEGSFCIVNRGGFLLDFRVLRVHSGQANLCRTPVFTCHPSRGQLAPFQRQVVRVVFSPKVASEHFFEQVEISLPNQRQTRRLFIRGAAFPDGFFLTNKFLFSPEKFARALPALRTRNAFDFCGPAPRAANLASNNRAVEFRPADLFLPHLVDRATRQVVVKLAAAPGAEGEAAPLVA